MLSEDSEAQSRDVGGLGAVASDAVPQAQPSAQVDWSALLADPASTRIHLVGVGGAGLSAIARLLLMRGFQVSGSDVRASATTTELAELGATVFIGHRGEQVAGASLLLISSAVRSDNPEVAAANRSGIPVVKREQFLQPLMAGHVSLCVAGTHGKTTTSAMLATLLDLAGAEPSFIVGSTILALGTAARAGRPAGPFVIEADEYDHTFLGLRPGIAVITNVEWDHVDCYPTPDSLHRAFEQFVDLVPAAGVVVYCGDDPGARLLLRNQAQNEAGDGQDLANAPRWVAYGLAEGSDWQAKALNINPLGGTDFEIWRQGVFHGRLSLRLPGQHNVLNALGAIAAAAEAGYDVFTAPYKNLKFSQNLAGTARRLEIKGEAYGIIVADDYAHHPTEVRATLSAVRQRFPRRAVWVLFQPHTYSRTQALLHDFWNSFENADHVLVTDIYAAREHDTLGVSAQDVVQVLAGHPDARYVGSLDNATDRLLAELKAGDVLITLGAGDGNQVGERVLGALRRRESIELPTFQKVGNSMDSYEALLTAIAQETGLAVRRHELLAGHTTMRIGGPADLFVAVSDVDDLKAVAALARQFQVPALILGGGSNLLVSDRGVRGLVIANGCRAVRLHEGDVVWAESGANLAGLARQAMRWGLAGLEWGVSVPGTVGGAVVGNAGAHGGSVADNLIRATLLMPDGSIAEWPAARFDYAYRSSALKAMIWAGQPQPLVLSAAFQLAPADSAELEERAAGFLAHRRTTQPVEPSAGSIFQNPAGDYAGRILDSLGFKGRSHGAAAFSSVHANFIVNHGGATAGDVLALIDEARRAARQQLGIELTPEILFVGE